MAVEDNGEDDAAVTVAAGWAGGGPGIRGPNLAEARPEPATRGAGREVQGESKAGTLPVLGMAGRVIKYFGLPRSVLDYPSN